MQQSTGRRILVVSVISLILGLPVLFGILLKNSKFGYHELPVYSSDELGIQVPYTIDSFSLIDQNGEIFTRDSIGDKIFISNFFFASCPDVCPIINGHMKIASQKLENSTDVLFISHTVDPYNDSVAVLREYADMFEVDDNQWKFLTGKKSTIYHLARDSYKAVIQEVPDTNNFIHSEKIMLIDKDFQVRGIYNGLKITEVMELIKDARFLLKTYKDNQRKEDE
ncbi:MAG: protein SCO1/2 [Bacteroidia bacterium]|jgi:protein SCO1/2|tara:strand:+ start:23337 stop:24008 length:672 start_codon:yes stop_codon:yes gene_type:complete